MLIGFYSLPNHGINYKNILYNSRYIYIYQKYDDDTNEKEFIKYENDEYPSRKGKCVWNCRMNNINKWILKDDFNIDNIKISNETRIFEEMYYSFRLNNISKIELKRISSKLIFHGEIHKGRDDDIDCFGYKDCYCLQSKPIINYIKNQNDSFEKKKIINELNLLNVCSCNESKEETICAISIEGINGNRIVFIVSSKIIEFCECGCGRIAKVLYTIKLFNSNTNEFINVISIFTDDDELSINYIKIASKEILIKIAALIGTSYKNIGSIVHLILISSDLMYIYHIFFIITTIIS